MEKGWPTGHTEDQDCTVGPDYVCTAPECGVSHEGDPCRDCNGTGFHKAGCPDYGVPEMRDAMINMLHGAAHLENVIRGGGGR